MGQIVEVVERPSARPGIVRFETNRVLSGTGHDRFLVGQPIEGNRPVDELARRLFNRGGISAIHVNGGVVTVDLAKGYGPDGIADLIRGLYTFYEAPEARADAVAAEAAIAADVPPLPTAGDDAVARNEAIASQAAPTPAPEQEPPTDVPMGDVGDMAPSADPPPPSVAEDPGTP
jgi:hypothetical protein